MGKIADFGFRIADLKKGKGRKAQGTRRKGMWDFRF
jgi:hypothetical protein